MKIESLEQLEAVVKFCRKQGISSIEVDGVKLAISEQPKRTRKSKEVQDEIETPDELTPEQLLMWSATPHTIGE